MKSLVKMRPARCRTAGSPSSRSFPQTTEEYLRHDSRLMERLACMYAARGPKTALSNTMRNESRNDPFTIIPKSEFTCISSGEEKERKCLPACSSTPLGAQNELPVDIVLILIESTRFSQVAMHLTPPHSLLRPVALWRRRTRRVPLKQASQNPRRDCSQISGSHEKKMRQLKSTEGRD